MNTDTTENRRFPAEWEPHGTWLAWPHCKTDWPNGYLAQGIETDVTEIIRLLAEHESVLIICPNKALRMRARAMCKDFHVNLENCRFYIQPTDRSWLRDSAPTAVKVNNQLRWIAWKFNAWGRCYTNYRKDQKIPDLIARITGAPMEHATWPDGKPIVMEGGAIDTDGYGHLVTTEQCLLSGPHWRNKKRSKEEYEEAFHRLLGVKKTLWLGRGFQPDQTQGHVDNVARFVGDRNLLVAAPHDLEDENMDIWQDNMDRVADFKRHTDMDLSIHQLPYTANPVLRRGQRLPASYINFYIGSSTVLVPQFNDPNDGKALEILQALFLSKNKQVVGHYSRNLCWGYGNVHCLLQQQPL